MNLHNLKQTVVALILMLLLAAPAYAQNGKGGGGSGGGSTTQQYTWVSLEAPAEAINNTGEIVGSANGLLPYLNVPDGQGGRITIDLSAYWAALELITPFDPQTGKGIGNINVLDINDSRQIVGGADVFQNGNFQRSAFFYSPATYDTNGTLILPERFQVILSGPEGDAFSDSVNNSGVVVGTDRGSGGGSFLWTEHSGVQYLDVPGGARGINTLGDICGQTFGTNQSNVWKLTPEGDFSYVFSKGQYSTEVADINDSGQMVGRYRSTVLSVGFPFRVESSGSVTTIKVEKNGGGFGTAINNVGDVVGVGYYSSGKRPFRFTSSGGVTDLLKVTSSVPTSINAQYVDPRGINDSGEIVGRVYVDSQYQGFLLSPIP